MKVSSGKFGNVANHGLLVYVAIDCVQTLQLKVLNAHALLDCSQTSTMLVLAPGRKYKPFNPFPHCPRKGMVHRTLYKDAQGNEIYARLLEVSAPELQRYRPPEYETLERLWWYDQGFGYGLVLLDMDNVEEACAEAKRLDETIRQAVVPDTFALGMSDSLGSPLPRTASPSRMEKYVWHGEVLDWTANPDFTVELSPEVATWDPYLGAELATWEPVSLGLRSRTS